MNIYKKISVAASIVAMAVLSSCSDKGYWDEAPSKQEFYFTSSSYEETLSPGANEIVIPVERLYTESTESVEVVFTPGDNCPSDITVESLLKYEVGSNTANVVIKIENAVPPFTYSGKLTFKDKANESYSGVSSVTINCPVAYTWVSLGKGKFTDAFVMEEGEFSVEILKADGFERYRVVEPYKEYYTTVGQEAWLDWIAGTGPEFVEFWENESGKLSFKSYATGLNYQAVPGQAIGAYSWDVFGEDSGYTGDNDIWYQPGFAVLSPVYYISGVGGFGQQKYAVQIQLPE